VKTMKLQEALSIQQSLIKIALGERPADGYIAGGRILNIYTGELLKENIALYRDRIAYVGPSKKMVGQETKVWEVKDRILVPGYMDPHAHTDLYYNPATFSEEVVKTGTTSIFSDMHDLANALGYAGIRQVLKDAPGYPLTFYLGVPSSSPPIPRFEGGRRFSSAQIRSLLKRPETLGLSELTAFIRLLKGESDLLKTVLLSRRLGKSVEGHTIGVNQEKLNALVGAGVTSCHEALTAEDVMKRLRLGLYIICRGGSIRNDLPELIKAVRRLSPYDTSRIMLTPDGLFPPVMARFGYLDHLLRQVMDLGLEPVKAYQMATLNPARYFGLEGDQGAVAPGRRADILILNDLKEPRPSSVMVKGQWIVRKGRFKGVPPAPFPNGTYDYPFRLSPLNPAFFNFQVDHQRPIPIIRIDDKTVTRRLDRKVQDARGLVRANQEEDLAKIALISRDGKKAGLGLVTGFGARLGAIASSIAHETHSLMVLGFDDQDMALAANQVMRIKGGIVIARQGRILDQLPLPIGGLMSDLKIPLLARKMEAFRKTLNRLGCRLEDPLLTLGFLSFTSMIELRITYSGVYEVKTGKILYNGFQRDNNILK